MASRASTGTSCSKPGRVASRSPPTTRTIPASTPTSRGRGCGSRAVLATAVLAALREGTYYSSTGPERAWRRARRRRGRGAVQPVPLRHARRRENARRCRARRQAAVLPSRARARTGRRREDHARTARAPARERLRPARACGRRGREGLDEPALAVSGRGRALEELAGRPFDLLVIGGGIVGAGVAAEAAHIGLAVALVERSDFGGATSSGSSKLIHGGLRYLRMGDVKLVRRGPPGAARAARGRRAPPRPPAPVPVAALPRWPVPAAHDPPRSGAVLAARGRPGRRSRRAGAGASQRPRSPPRRSAQLRGLRGRVDERRAALPRERAGGGGRGRDGAQLRRGHVAAHQPAGRSSARRCSTARPVSPSRSPRARS